MASLFTARHGLGLRSTRLWTPSTRSAFSTHLAPRPCSIRQTLQYSTNSVRSAPKPNVSPIFKAAGVATIGLGLSTQLRTPIKCDVVVDSPPGNPSNLDSNSANPPPPTSSVNVYELSFGTVCGVCAGVFIRKGAKALAFFLGGIFVLLQYLGTFSIAKVDWRVVGNKFENAFYKTDAVTGAKRPPSVVSAWNWLINFLTADFQPRASFLAGLALGLRMG
ncbi:FUN14 family-domain-containing protein [Pterulicium gracile]|uniref:FUN14 family-domain-containing protein n=1 Tax=Pterulicium gracile TaxID=1884261 RepID=A0A5C3R0G0_9AGAR|nr:FUN14 family-domain-containing protein [Pterula gracilis]